MKKPIHPLAGIIWSWVFYHRPNIVLMGLSHAVLGTMLHQVVQLYMRIGPFYQNPDANIVTHIVPGLSRLMDIYFLDGPHGPTANEASPL